MDPYCVKYRLFKNIFSRQKREQTTKVVKVNSYIIFILRIFFIRVDLLIKFMTIVRSIVAVIVGTLSSS